MKQGEGLEHPCGAWATWQQEGLDFWTELLRGHMPLSCCPREACLTGHCHGYLAQFEDEGKHGQNASPLENAGEQENGASEGLGAPQKGV